MALYAFDGTGNYDKPGVEQDTNVLWFRAAYGVEKSEYEKGIGTRLGRLGAAIGGMFGAGGHPRVKRMIKCFEQRVATDSVVDVVGFSRGAALALDFVNRLAEKFPQVPVRFLGLWDMVPAFGLPFIPWDPTWRFDLPPTVQNCCHALALDERRFDFRLRRVKSQRAGQLCEVWFRGVHSDIGGGDTNAPRASIALDWMFTHAAKATIILDSGIVATNRLRMQEDAEISEHKKFWLEVGHRDVKNADSIHVTVLSRLESTERNYNSLTKFDLDVVDNTHTVVARLEHGIAGEINT